MFKNNHKITKLLTTILTLTILSSLNAQARILQETSRFISNFFSSMPEAYQIKILIALILFFIMSVAINLSATFQNNPKSKTTMYFAALLLSTLLTIGIPDTFAILIADELGTVLGWIVLSLPLLFLILFFWAERSLKQSLGNDDKTENFLEVIFTVLAIIILNFTASYMYTASPLLNGTLSQGILESYGDILTILMIIYIIKLAISLFNFFNHNVKIKNSANNIINNTANTIKQSLREKKLSNMEKKTVKEMINLDLTEGKDLSVLKDIISKLESIIRYFSNPRIWDKIDASALEELSKKLRILEQEGISKTIKLVKDLKLEEGQTSILKKELLKLADLESIGDSQTRALFKKIRKKHGKKTNEGHLSNFQKKLNELHRTVKEELLKLKNLDEKINRIIKISEEDVVEIEKGLKQLASEINFILSTMHNLTTEEKEQAAKKLSQLYSKLNYLEQKIISLEKNRNEFEIELKETETILNDESVRLIAEVKTEEGAEAFLRSIGEI